MRKRDHAYAKARALRREPSLPEGLLWRELRGKRSGLKFRQQHPVGPFVLDFYCAQARLGIEIDGVAHDMGDRPDRDIRRDAWLAEQGIEIVRIAAGDVLTDPHLVVETIAATCRARCA